jgi:hypothetical protein
MGASLSARGREIRALAPAPCAAALAALVAIGLAGHSPDPRDVMFDSATREAFEGPSARDRATLATLYARPIGFRMVAARASR